MSEQCRVKRLGNSDFLSHYNVKHAYVAGAMYKGIASVDLVVAMAKRGLLAFLGTGGMKNSRIEDSIQSIKSQLGEPAVFGMNMLANFERPDKEFELIQLYLKHGIHIIEAASYVSISDALIYYRVSGLTRRGNGVHIAHKLMAKISRPEVAKRFFSPAPVDRVNVLVQQGLLSRAQAELAKEIPMADDICVESDSGGHTDQGVMAVLLPTIKRLVDQNNQRQRYQIPVRVGAAGGLGTPEAAAAAFLLGADFIVTGSINQCTVEAGVSDQAKDMLAQAEIQDTVLVPAGDMFELGAKVQVLKKGSLFHARANKLYELYRHYPSLDALPEAVRLSIEKQIFNQSLDDIWMETEAYYRCSHPQELTKAKESPKHKMALVFKWYFVHGTRLALEGDPSKRMNFQIQCGPALGAFNTWVHGTKYQDWRNRRVGEISFLLIDETLSYIESFSSNQHQENGMAKTTASGII